MQHKNVHPITRCNKFSTVMKALHPVREDRSQLFERKGQTRNNSSTQKKQKKQKVTHFSRKKNNSSFCLFDYFW